jgi:hypothetical protein
LIFFSYLFLFFSSGLLVSDFLIRLFSIFLDWLFSFLFFSLSPFMLVFWVFSIFVPLVRYFYFKDYVAKVYALVSSRTYFSYAIIFLGFLKLGIPMTVDSFNELNFVLHKEIKDTAVVVKQMGVKTLPDAVKASKVVLLDKVKHDLMPLYSIDQWKEELRRKNVSPDLFALSAVAKGKMQPSWLAGDLSAYIFPAISKTSISSSDVDELAVWRLSKNIVYNNALQFSLDNRYEAALKLTLKDKPSAPLVVSSSGELVFLKKGEVDQVPYFWYGSFQCKLAKGGVFGSLDQGLSLVVNPSEINYSDLNKDALLCDVDGLPKRPPVGDFVGTGSSVEYLLIILRILLIKRVCLRRVSV